MAIKSDGTVWAWGNNNTGQLGEGAACGKTCATPVEAIGLTGAGSIAGGYVHSLAETISGSVWGWGDNSGGELGNGTTTVATRAGTRHRRHRRTLIRLPGPGLTHSQTRARQGSYT